MSLIVKECFYVIISMKRITKKNNYISIADKNKKGDLMDKKKKIAIISVITILILLIIIGGIVWYFIANNKTNSDSNNQGKSEINKLYETLKTTSIFSFELILDDENHKYYAKSNNMACIETTSNDEETKYIVKNGNTYFLVDDTKTYYTYSNNQANLNMVTKGLERFKDLDYEIGKEKINNKNYYYEEYTRLTAFAMGDFTEDSEDVKTRFYFDDDELVYIKTIEEDKEELLEVNISYNVNQNSFQIPSDYKNA